MKIRADDLSGIEKTIWLSGASLGGSLARATGHASLTGAEKILFEEGFRWANDSMRAVLAEVKE